MALQQYADCERRHVTQQVLKRVTTAENKKISFQRMI
jgi:hypothetical protein